MKHKMKLASAIKHFLGKRLVVRDVDIPAYIRNSVL